MTAVRATIHFLEDEAAAVQVFGQWLAVAKPHMAFVSHDYGCGCCVHFYDVEGPQEIIERLPPGMRSSTSDWIEKGQRSGDPRFDIVPTR